MIAFSLSPYNLKERRRRLHWEKKPFPSSRETSMTPHWYYPRHIKKSRREKIILKGMLPKCMTRNASYAARGKRSKAKKDSSMESSETGTNSLLVNQNQERGVGGHKRARRTMMTWRNINLVKLADAQFLRTFFLGPWPWLAWQC